MPLSRICPFREIWTLNVISQCDKKFSFILLSLSCTFVTSLLDGHNFPLPYFSFYLLTVCPQRRQRETGCLFTVTYIKVGKQAFQSQCVRHRRGPIGVQKESEATEEGGVRWCWKRGGGGCYLVSPETRAGRISYRGLFAEETPRLWDSGIVRESPSAGLLKRGEKFEGKERWGDTRRETKSSTRGWENVKVWIQHKVRNL